MKASLKIDTVIKSVNIMEIQVKELFLNERDYNELLIEAKKNKDIIEEMNNLMYKSVIGLVKISKICL